ncbi:MAG: nucleotidyltransferase domain-containing protein [Nanoarchaeota archaeon]|nr:nucleotidyltransferase domain-containing protein [Nanoarchaeota archaeon]
MAKREKKKKNSAKEDKKTKKKSKVNLKKVPSLQLKDESEIAMDFAIKVYKRFDKIIKSVILFGSTVKKTSIVGSDIDIIILIDDVSIKWTQELIAWYREELDKILRVNPYKRNLHINTIKLSTWWEDLIKGDPVVLNVLRNGEAMIDFAGFFEPLKSLLIQGKIRATPESIYNLLQRAPTHLLQSKAYELGSIEGLYWTMIDSAQAALIAANVQPPSPEHIAQNLKETFVSNRRLDMKYVLWYRDLLVLHKKISHGEISDLKGVEIDEWQERTEQFLSEMIKLVKEIVDQN